MLGAMRLKEEIVQAIARRYQAGRIQPEGKLEERGSDACGQRGNGCIGCAYYMYIHTSYC